MPEIVAWRYRHRRDTAWSLTQDAEPIERLGKATDDRDGTLTNERLPSYEIEPLYVRSGEVPAGLTREHLRVALAACEEIEAEGWRETSDAFRETRRALRAALEESPIQAVLREEEAERDSWGRAALRGQEEPRLTA